MLIVAYRIPSKFFPNHKRTHRRLNLRWNEINQSSTHTTCGSLPKSNWLNLQIFNLMLYMGHDCKRANQSSLVFLKQLYKEIRKDDFFNCNAKALGPFQMKTDWGLSIHGYGYRHSPRNLSILFNHKIKFSDWKLIFFNFLIVICFSNSALVVFRRKQKWNNTKIFEEKLKSAHQIALTLNNVKNIEK